MSNEASLRYSEAIPTSVYPLITQNEGQQKTASAPESAASVAALNAMTTAAPATFTSLTKAKLENAGQWLSDNKTDILKGALVVGLLTTAVGTGLAIGAYASGSPLMAIKYLHGWMPVSILSQAGKLAQVGVLTATLGGMVSAFTAGFLSQMNKEATSDETRSNPAGKLEQAKQWIIEHKEEIFKGLLIASAVAVVAGTCYTTGILTSGARLTEIVYTLVPRRYGWGWDVIAKPILTTAGKLALSGTIATFSSFILAGGAIGLLAGSSQANKEAKHA